MSDVKVSKLVGWRKFSMAGGLAILSYLFFFTAVSYGVEDSQIAVLMTAIYAGLGAIGGLYFNYNVQAKKANNGNSKISQDG